MSHRTLLPAQPPAHPALLFPAFLCAVAAAGPGCSSTPRVDPFLVRAEVRGSYAFQPAGFTRAREDADEAGAGGVIEGDDVKLQRDLETEGAIGWGATFDFRPFHNDEVRFTYDRFGDFEGDALLSRPRRFDGRTYIAGEHVASDLSWQRISGSVAHRVLALGSPADPLADVLVRAGAESSVFDASIEGSVTPEESRQLRSGAPFAGIEGRAAVMPRTLFVHGIQAGYWNHEGSRFAALDLAAGLRVRVAGPVDLTVAYAFLLRDGRARLDGGEVSRVELEAHVVSFGLGLHF